MMMTAMRSRSLRLTTTLSEACPRTLLSVRGRSSQTALAAGGLGFQPRERSLLTLGSDARARLAAGGTDLMLREDLLEQRAALALVAT